MEKDGADAIELEFLGPLIHESVPVGERLPLVDLVGFHQRRGDVVQAKNDELAAVNEGASWWEEIRRDALARLDVDHEPCLVDCQVRSLTTKKRDPLHWRKVSDAGKHAVQFFRCATLDLLPSFISH